MRAFRGKPQELKLPTAPDPALIVMTEDNRPQPRLDADLGDGMTVSVGRVRACPVLTHKFVALGHNTIRGAAGASMLNAELMQAESCCERLVARYDRYERVHERLTLAIFFKHRRT